MTNDLHTSIIRDHGILFPCLCQSNWKVRAALEGGHGTVGPKQKQAARRERIFYKLKIGDARQKEQL